MTPPIRFPKSAVLACLAAAAFAAAATTGHAQVSVPLYSETTSTATSVTQASNHYLQLVTPGVPGPGTYTLTGFTFSAHFNLGTTATPALTNQAVQIFFYNGVDPSSSSDVLANATDAAITGISGTLTAPAAPGNYTYSYTLAAPVTLTLTGTSVGVEVYLTDLAGNFASTTNIQGQFGLVAPVVGTSNNYVWNDVNDDNTFTGAEQTNFGQATGVYIPVTLRGFTIVPEPGTCAMIVLGGVGLAAAIVRRRMV